MEDRRYKSNLRTLRILLVISFVVTGYFLLSELVMGLSQPMMKARFEQDPETFLAPYTGMMEQYGKMSPETLKIMFERSMEVPQWYYLLSALLDAVSFAGLIMMWKLRKSGFHYYTISKLLLMLLPMLFLDRSYVGIGDIMLGVLFIAYYFFLLRALQAFGKQDHDNQEESQLTS